MSRVVVFVDYSSSCRAARQTFDHEASTRCTGQFDPLLLADMLVGQGRSSRQLTEVRVYRGVPDGRRDPEGFSAVLRQMDRWSDAGVTVVRRPLEYPSTASGGPGDGEPEQKGLAVALAVDVVMMAWCDQYDIAVVCSRDADLAPGLKAVLDHTWKAVEVASWRSPCRPSERLRVPAEDVPCHWLDAAAYDKVADPTDYTTCQ